MVNLRAALFCPGAMRRSQSRLWWRAATFSCTFLLCCWMLWEDWCGWEVCAAFVYMEFIFPLHAKWIDSLHTQQVLLFGLLPLLVLHVVAMRLPRSFPPSLLSSPPPPSSMDPDLGGKAPEADMGRSDVPPFIEISGASVASAPS